MKFIVVTEHDFVVGCHLIIAHVMCMNTIKHSNNAMLQVPASDWFAR